MIELDFDVERDPPKGDKMIGVTVTINRDGNDVDLDVADCNEEELKAWAATQTPEEAASVFSAAIRLFSIWVDGAKTEEVVQVAADGTLVQHKSMPLPTFTQEEGAVIKAVRMWPTSDNSLWPTENEARQHEIKLKTRT